MGAYDCYYDNNGCYVCPEIPAEPAHAAQVVNSPNLGWNAGANTIQVRDGNLRAAWSIDAPPVGVMVGLKHGRDFPNAPELIEHGLYLYTLNGQVFVEVRERGVSRGVPAAYTLGSLLEIRREAGRVTYWRAGEQLYASSVRSTGPVLVNACLYSAGDAIP